jgi:hypothetical protein
MAKKNIGLNRKMIIIDVTIVVLSQEVIITLDVMLKNVLFVMVS